MTGNPTIRPADLEADALAIVDGARDFISRMDCREFLPESDDEIAREAGRMLALPGVEVIVAERKGEIVGGIGVLYSPFLWNSHVTAAEELFWWTRQDAPNTTALLLLKAVARRMRERGVQVAQFREPINAGRSFEKIYRRMGLRPIETGYVGAP